MPLGMPSLSCGLRREAVRVLGISASAALKSVATGEVRRSWFIACRMYVANCSMYSSAWERNISRASGRALSKPTETSAALMLRRN